MDKKDIGSMTFSDVLKDFESISEKSYRARQVYEWLAKGAESFDEMTNIPKLLQDKLKKLYIIKPIKIKNKKISKDTTVKYLFELCDGELIESVVMHYKHGYSMCLSTQAGCKMGCSFCTTGKGGFSRNLLPCEMISQIQCAQKDLNIKISTIVLMGMGEPLDNYENVLKFLKIISSVEHLNMGMRHISLSTCGMVDKIYELAKENLQITLSVSLHAPDDDIRDKIMKINHKWKIKDLMESCKYYISCTGRRISFEYMLINGVNDSAYHAEKLSQLLKGMLCHVNLIPMNESLGCPNLKTSSSDKIYKFKDILEKRGVNTTVRRTLGKDIQGACGQLKYNRISKEVLS